MDIPIIAQIQQQCDNFPNIVKESKKSQNKTIQDIADATGVPASHLGKFFSNNLTIPNLYNAIAVCMYLGISIDKSFGLKVADLNCQDFEASLSQYKDRAELQAKVAALERELEYCEKDRKHLLDSLRSRKMIMAVLFGICILLAVLFGICILLIAAFGFGVIYDTIRPNEGFIQGNHIAGISIALITVIVVAIAITVSIMAITFSRKGS